MSNHAILDSNTHRDLRVHVDAGAEYGDAVMATLAVPSEFRSLQAHYPILFRRETGQSPFFAVALFGFENGENLFLDGNRWDARQRPLSMAVQPLLVGRPATEGAHSQVHIDMGHARISNGSTGVRLFDADGIATPYLDDMAEKLGALDEGYRNSAAFFQALSDYDLLEPFSLEVTLDDQSKNSLVGFHIIDEAKLRLLDAETLGKLHHDGHLMPIFMALASLSQIGGLVERKNRKTAGG